MSLKSDRLLLVLYTNHVFSSELPSRLIVVAFSTLFGLSGLSINYTLVYTTHRIWSLPIVSVLVELAFT